MSYSQPATPWLQEWQHPGLAPARRAAPAPRDSARQPQHSRHIGHSRHSRAHLHPHAEHAAQRHGPAQPASYCQVRRASPCYPCRLPVGAQGVQPLLCFHGCPSGCSMSEAQLRNRIRKITKPGKMRSFVAVRPYMLEAASGHVARLLHKDCGAEHAGRILAASCRCHV